MKNFSESDKNLGVDLTLSPLDGRYADASETIKNIWNERNLNRNRIKTEVLWLRFLARQKILSKKLPLLSDKHFKILNRILEDDMVLDIIAIRAKEIEKITRHDVKAVEYSICEFLAKDKFDPKWINLVHFACTSEDINNASYAQMLKSTVLLFKEKYQELIQLILDKARPHYATPMLSRTHGQPASPSTLGKEWLVFALRLSRILEEAHHIRFYVKFSGAVGNYHAHAAAFPEVDWNSISTSFIEDELCMDNAICTTQIEPHDYVASICHWMIRVNTVLLDFVKDMWAYVSLEYFVQRNQKGEIGSSTMPHKINPIDFENAEGNLGLAIALLQHFSTKLPVSRLQRDLSDSTVQRSLGVAFGYSLVALQSSLKGLQRLEVDEVSLKNDLMNRWEILGEAVQSVLRISGVDNAYEIVKEKTRGKKWNKSEYEGLIRSLPIKSDKHRKMLLELTPLKYVGQAEKICEETEKIIYQSFKKRVKK